MKANNVRSIVDIKKNVINILMKVSERKIKLHTNIKPKIEYDDGEIVSLRCFDDYVVKVGGCVTIDSNKYKISKIASSRININGKYVYFLYTNILNKTCFFLMPLLGGMREEYLWSNNFINCFYKREGFKKEKLYVLYRFSADEFLIFEEYIKSHDMFEKKEDIDKYQVLITFNIPDIYSNIFKLFKKGRYSLFPQEYKEQILKFHENKNSQLERILYKDEELRKLIENRIGVKLSKDAELHDVQHEEDETFWNKYKIE